MTVYMVRHKHSGLFALRRCCKITWAQQCSASVCSTKGSLQELLGMIPHGDLEFLEVKTYQLVDPDEQPEKSAEYEV